MISTAFLTDYRKQVYTLPRNHSHLKLFLSLIPGSEIVTAEYNDHPLDFEQNWYNYRYIHEDRKFVHNLVDDEFKNQSIKVMEYLNVWTNVIDKLNFVYEKELNPFHFNKRIDNEQLISLLQNSALRCENIIIDEFNNGTVANAKFKIGRELILNIYL